MKLLILYFILEFMFLRLISEISREICVGRLEVFYNGVWGIVGKSNMFEIIVGVVCR